MALNGISRITVMAKPRVFGRVRGQDQGPGWVQMSRHHAATSVRVALVVSGCVQLRVVDHGNDVWQPQTHTHTPIHTHTHRLCLVTKRTPPLSHPVGTERYIRMLAPSLFAI